MTFGKSISTCFGKYVTFSGRASRSEYWFWQLFIWLTTIAIFVLTMAFGTGVGSDVGGVYGAAGGALAGLGMGLVFFGLFYLVIFLPSLAVTVRRLHDSGKSGWFLLLYLIPYIGAIIIFVFTLLSSTAGDNQYGPKP